MKSKIYSKIHFSDRFGDEPRTIEYNFETLAQNAESVLEEIFAKWNNGSGMECQEFLNSRVRSLSVGDSIEFVRTFSIGGPKFIEFGSKYKCAPFGWCKE